MSDHKLTSALNIMRRMPPSSLENSLAGLMELVPDIADDLLTHVDQPLKLAKDSKTGQLFVLCDYNRDGDSFRSPWSSEYFPPNDDGLQPPARLRQMEIEANTIFDSYRKLYFEGGHSSVYFFSTEEKEDDSFGACFLIHKDVKDIKGLNDGWWDSIHVFEVNQQPKKKDVYEYKLTTTVMVSMVMKNQNLGHVDLSGSMTQQATQTLTLDTEHPHIANMGKMLEEMESKLRNSIEGIYIQKTREIIHSMRPTGRPVQSNVSRSLMDELSRRQANN